jgi:two-component system phosphate regulon sensor histidine kinase PhoR
VPSGDHLTLGVVEVLDRVADNQRQRVGRPKRVPDDIKPVAVAELLSQAADAIRSLTEKKSIAVRLDPVAEDLEAECDPEAIHQVLMNLLDNAVKYTPEGGLVTLGAQRVGQDVEVYVRDTGIGIAADEIPRLFERFYRVDRARSRALGGTGLGLAIVKHLVRAHHGSVRVQSEPGAGSTFCFRIPMAAQLRRS